MPARDEGMSLELSHRSVPVTGSDDSGGSATVRGRADFDRACALLRAGQPEEASALFTLAQQAGVNLAECCAARWQAYMLRGDFECAWRESDTLIELSAPDPHRLWDQQSFFNRRVVLRCLHGFGDAVQMMRYVPMLRAQARFLAVEAPVALLPLLRTLDSIDVLDSWELETPERYQWDQQIEVMELPRAFRTTVATIPPVLPQWPHHFGSTREQDARTYPLRVGLAWEAAAWNPARSTPVACLVPLLRAFPACEFHGLLPGSRNQALAEVTSGLANFVDASALTRTPYELARFIAGLDLVISVDTFAVHLAGALNKPVWLLLRREADWRWMLGRSDSPWYPSMKIFRQTTEGDWTQIISEVAAHLSAFVHVPGGSRR